VKLLSIFDRWRSWPGAVRHALAHPEEFFWQKCEIPLFGGCDIEGRRLSLAGQVWRRLSRDGFWQYRQDPATEQDYLDNAW
jgi:hypothetical protein